MDNQVIRSFPPIVDENSRILVLGTMPGAESLRRQQYYGYGRNSFWTILFALYGLERPEDYENRVRFLHEKRIALWDVVESCIRPGSADADIRDAKPNKIVALLDAYPNIRTVFFNGNGAEKLFAKHILPDLSASIHTGTLPSTSPAYAIPYGRKLEGWKKILGFL